MLVAMLYLCFPELHVEVLYMFEKEKEKSKVLIEYY